MSADPKALEIAKDLHDHIGDRACRTYLYGSRAIGNHRPDSDVDIAVLTTVELDPATQETFSQRARELQLVHLPDAAGAEVVYYTIKDFQGERYRRNTLPNHIAKHGVPVVSHSQFQPEREETSWEDVRILQTVAEDLARDLMVAAKHGTAAIMSDRGLGRTAQTALESIYKATLGAMGASYPQSGRDAHDLSLMADLIRENPGWLINERVPGHQHLYLTEFAGSRLYNPTLPALEREAVAHDVPRAVWELSAFIRLAEGQE